MPRRTTKAKAVPLTAEEEERNKQIPLIIKDLRDKVEDIRKKMEAEGRAIVNSLKNQHMVKLSQMDSKTRNMSVELLFARQEKHYEKSERISNIGIDLDREMNMIKNNVKNTTRKRKLASAKKVASSATRSSSRKRAKDIPEQAMMTPLNSRQMMNLGQTPMITPKFNTMTPHSRTVHRAPRANETLVSLSGSPVAPTFTVAKGRGKKKETMDTVPVPLGNDLTLNLPFSADLAADGLDLDEDQLNKLNLLRQGLDNMLRGRLASTTTDSE